MSEQQNLDLVRRGYELFGQGDIMGLISMFDDNITWVTPGPADLPLAGNRTGHSQVLEFFNTLANVVDTERFEAREFFAKGDRVVVLGADTSRVKATGRAVDYDWVHAFTIRNGKVVAFQEYGDTSAMVAEFRTAAARA